MSSSGILCRLIIPKQLVTASSRSRTVESVSTIFCSHYHNSYSTVVSPPFRLLFRRWNSNKSTAGSSPTKSDEQLQERHPDAEKEPLPEWPDGVNPHTGERGGPKGPEPTRYGDWERKGRVSDFWQIRIYCFNFGLATTVGVGSKVVSLDSESSNVCITDVLDNTYRD